MADLVQEVGALAGLATVVGLAVLCALHRSQARDVKRLSDWAGGAPAPAPSTRAPRPIARPAASRYGWIGTRYVAVALVGLLVFGGAAAYGVTLLTGDDGNSGNTKVNHHSRLVKKHKPNRAVITPANVTVAVLNGTTVPGLAASLREQIAAAGFRKGMINVFSDQQLAESVVQYAPGHEAEAEAVGRRFAISKREPITAESRALAGDATVIVIAGADKAP